MVALTTTFLRLAGHLAQSFTWYRTRFDLDPADGARRGRAVPRLSGCTFTFTQMHLTRLARTGSLDPREPTQT
jgi:hypothetical protein